MYQTFRPLLDALKKRGADPQAVDGAAEEAMRTGRSTRDVLINDRIVDETELTEASADAYGINSVDLVGYPIDAAAMAKIPPVDRAAAPRAGPGRQEGRDRGRITDPTDVVALDDVRAATGLSVRPVVVDGFCWNVQNPNSAGSFIVLGSVGKGSCRRGYDNIEAFSPDASVGAGAACADSGQLVNFSQFGRCLAPDPTYIAWNQKWALPAVTTGSSATGRITTSPSSTAHCLKSPGSTAAGQYVTIDPCPSGSTPLNMTWTEYLNTGVYETSYRIKDGYGSCLAPTDPTASPPDFYSKGSEISKIIVAPCSGSALQKWNAPPNILQTLPFKDIGREIGGVVPSPPTAHR